MTDDIGIKPIREFADQDKIEKELKRIIKLPRDGYFTLLHHMGPSIEPTHNVMERVQYIVEKKPRREVLIRLQNIHYLSKHQMEYYISWIRSFYEMCEPTGPTGKSLSMQQSTYQMPWYRGISWEELQIRLQANPVWRRLEIMWLRSISPNITWNGYCIFPVEPPHMVLSKTLVDNQKYTFKL